jgi:hypothetical protein
MQVENFEVFNMKSKVTIQPNLPAPRLPIGSFIVVNDNSIGRVFISGDTLQVSAKNPANRQIIKAAIKVKGGTFSSHIEKISVPDKAIIN